MFKLTLPLATLLFALSTHAAIQFTIDKSTGIWNFSTDESIEFVTDTTDSLASWVGTAGGFNNADFTWADGASSGTGNASFLINTSDDSIERFDLRLYGINTASVTSSFVMTTKADFDTSSLSALTIGPSLGAFAPSGNNFLTYTVVPEASDIALLLGVIAFGIPVLKRRKRA